MPDLLDLDITALAAGGDGVGRVDGLAVFVPRTAPGDRIRASITTHGRFGRGVVRAVLVASERRVEPSCVHFTRDHCGGCQWQHLSIAEQREAKAQLVVDAFARIAHRQVARPAVVGDAVPLAYRRTISFTVRGRGRRRVGGFRTVYSPDELIAVEQCLLAHPALQASWHAVRAQLAELPVPDGARGRPDLRVTLRHEGDGAVSLVVEGGKEWSIERAAALASGATLVQSVWWRPRHGGLTCLWRADGAAADGAAADGAAADGAAVDGAAGDSATVAAAVSPSFVQVNAGVAALLHARLRELVLHCRALDPAAARRAGEPFRVVDGYAGRGDLASSLAADGCVVQAIERDAAAASVAAARLSPPSRMLPGTVERRLSEALPADLVVLNPPRAGLDGAVTAELRDPSGTSDAPRWLIYVSCDPATLARDVARLAGWEVASLECFDMFPQTAHVETVCLLRPEGQ